MAGRTAPTPPLGIPPKLHELAEHFGYLAYVQATITRRGVPPGYPSARPYHLARDGRFVAAFASLAALENFIRARESC